MLIFAIVFLLLGVAAILGIISMCAGGRCGKAQIETPLSRIEERRMRDLEWERALRR